MDVLCTVLSNKHLKVDCMHAYKKGHPINTAIAPLKLTSSISKPRSTAFIIMKAIHLLGLFITVQQCILLASSVPIAQHRRRRQLPCTHPLRLSAPEYFTHCSSTPCTYGSWSSWERVSGSETNVPQSQCESGRAYTEERTRSTTGSGCNQPVRETRRICKHTIL